jgi:hypothetical protein
MWDCHYERSEESAFVCGSDDGWKQQIPHRLNFTPTSAKTALVGDPGSAVRDDNSMRLFLVSSTTKLLPSSS